MAVKRMGEVWWLPPADDNNTAMATAMAMATATAMAAAVVAAKAMAEGDD
jgi:hypothetical protein